MRDAGNTNIGFRLIRNDTGGVDLNDNKLLCPLVRSSRWNTMRENGIWSLCYSWEYISESSGNVEMGFRYIRKRSEW